MIFTETKIRGAFILELERIEDQRGFFARTLCSKELRMHGLRSDLIQHSVSFNEKRGTLRGLHYQVPPHEEVKLVRCTRGAIYDVIIDLRLQSATYRLWEGVELTTENHKMLYVPEGFAHGFQTLVDDTEVFYPVSEFYAPEFERGVRWNDPVFGIWWPIDRPTISPGDAQYPDFI